MRDELKKMRESQERTNVFMTSMMSVIQNRLSQEDLNDILQAAKQVYYIIDILLSCSDFQYYDNLN